MFDEQLHHFIASPRRASNSGQLVNPLPSFSTFPLLHGHSHVASSRSSSQPSLSFDSYTHHQLLLPLHQHPQQFLQPVLHHNAVNAVNAPIDEKPDPEAEEEVNDNNVDLDGNDAVSVEPWSNDEVLALLKIRSTMESWFPEFTWEHVSRKLADLGFKLRSGEKCKEKFEEENRYFNNINTCTKSFKPFLSELEELYTNTNIPQNPTHNHDNNTVNIPQKTQTLVDIVAPIEPAKETPDHHDEIECSEKEEERQRTTKKRKRHSEEGSKFEMFKGFCEEIVNKLMTQQEEMHNKLLEDMVKRDQEKLRKEDLWKKQEMDRMNKELKIMAREQAVAGDRQVAIMEFLKKFTPNPTTSPNSSSSSDHSKPNIATSSSSLVQSHGNDRNPNGSSTPSMLVNPSSQNLNPNPSLTWTGDHDVGKRWPRDEVLALINLRCSLCNNGDSSDQSTAAKAVPLWERISQGMSEMGFKRSAKRCKEKWENINKYFRKTKDVNKKRSVDSRTCPYFHQLSSLYNKGTLHHEVHDHHHDHDLDDHRVTEGGERSDHVITNTSVGVVPASFDFEF